MKSCAQIMMMRESIDGECIVGVLVRDECCFNSHLTRNFCVALDTLLPGFINKVLSKKAPA